MSLRLHARISEDVEKMTPARRAATNVGQTFASQTHGESLRFALLSMGSETLLIR